VAFLPGHVWGAAPLGENILHTTRFSPLKTRPSMEGWGSKTLAAQKAEFLKKGLSEFFRASQKPSGVR
jgi:hypothetical protein